MYICKVVEEDKFLQSQTFTASFPKSKKFEPIPTYLYVFNKTFIAILSKSVIRKLHDCMFLYSKVTFYSIFSMSKSVINKLGTYLNVLFTNVNLLWHLFRCQKVLKGQARYIIVCFHR
jgi:hypothetical protein